MMAIHTWILAIIAYIVTVNEVKSIKVNGSNDNQRKEGDLDKDLKLAASTYYSTLANPYVDNGYGVIGYGTVDNNYNVPGINDNNRGYNRYDSFSGHGYTSGYQADSGYYGYSNYNNGLEHKPPVNIAASANSGNGGYGGYSGNGGLNSYLGYNNPYYNGANHLGYGYYNKAGYGGIYNSGITPSLVTGYRGYSKK